MLRTNVPRAIRHLRHHRGWRQSDLAARSGVSRQAISRIERSHLGGIPLNTLSQLSDAFGATADVYIRWQGEELDRLVDATHAATQEHAASLLRASGWTVKTEVSFNHYGDRGRVDVLAFHEGTAALMVGEVKSGIGDLQETLGRLDVKVRLGARLAREAGWRAPLVVIPALVLVESGTARRILASHPTLFAPFSARGRAALSWVRAPWSSPPTGLLWFVNLPGAHGVSISRAARVRLRRGRR